MEQKRILLAVVISFLIFLLWDTFFIPKQPVKNDQPKTSTAYQTEVYTPPADPLYKEEAETKLSAEQFNADGPKTITVTTPLYQVQISEKGGVFKKFQLLKYNESVSLDSDYLQMISENTKDKNLKIKFANSFTEIEQAIFKADTDQQFLKIDNTPKKITFSYKAQNDFIIEKTCIFYPDTYLIGFNISLKNGSGQPIEDQMVISIAKYFPKSNSYSFEGPAALIDGKLEEIDIEDISDSSSLKGKVEWILLKNRYFMSSIIPEKPFDAEVRLSEGQNSVVENSYVQNIKIPARTQQNFKYSLFFGPESMKDLKKAGYRLEKSVDFGMFDFIAKPCLWLMNLIHSYIPNYGIAIILLTILTKIILWPLGNWSYKSMAQMKKMQPLLTDLRKKYPNDKKKMNEEMMSLYRTYKINPMGGCLPMILQIPIFFALYRMLYGAVELRHAHFLGWINDLSAPDRLFNFGFSIPFMDPPYGIPVLTIIMGATMFIQQKISPPMGDPTQAKMMMLMPIVFTVIFINFSSGLVLYWLTNNILSIAQQYYVTRKEA